MINTLILNIQLILTHKLLLVNNIADISFVVELEENKQSATPNRAK